MFQQLLMGLKFCSRKVFEIKVVHLTSYLFMTKISQLVKPFLVTRLKHWWHHWNAENFDFSKF
jgi:hypothetical protein